MERLGETTDGYLAELTDAVFPHLPRQTLARRDDDLTAAVEARKTQQALASSD